MKSELNLSNLYQIKSALVDALIKSKNEERVLLELTIEKVDNMMTELYQEIGKILSKN